MIRFSCPTCANIVYFENRQCLNCSSRLAYDPVSVGMQVLHGSDGDWRTSGGRHLCENATHDACNWLAEDAGPGLCAACRHNRTIPDLSVPENLELWRRIELAKHHLFYSLLRWRLPVETRSGPDGAGLAFDFMADAVEPGGGVARVMTGHESGLITVNIAEADDAEREKRRTAMSEPYRTVLGHMRHEVGHWYWERLVRDGPLLQPFRALFGDERADYGAALAAHYRDGPPADWQGSFVSAYASAHPFEDFAESFAHYTHIVDALETAVDYGMRVSDLKEARAVSRLDPYLEGDTRLIVSAFSGIALAVNAVNRSLGQPDLYPFVLSEPAIEKLAFVHALIRGAGEAGAA